MISLIFKYLFYICLANEQANQLEKNTIILNSYDVQPPLKRAKIQFKESQERTKDNWLLLDMPCELTQHILSYIDILNLLKIASTCSTFFEIVKSICKNKTLCLSSSAKYINHKHFKGISNQTFIYSFKLNFYTVQQENLRMLSLGNLKKLDLNYTHIGTEGARILANSTSIRTLCLAGIDLTDEGAQLIFENPYFKKLILAANSLTDKSVEQFPQSNKTLINLILNSNKLTDMGAISLSQSLSLKKLNLFGNNISDEGADKLIQSNISKIGLSNNRLTQEKIRELDEVIRSGELKNKRIQLVEF